MTVGKIKYLALQSVALSWLISFPALGCDCVSISVPDVSGETNEQRHNRYVQARMASETMVVAGRFISVSGVSGIFRSKTPSGRFEVRKILKGSVAPFITVYTDDTTNCSAFWIFEKALARRDDLIISAQPRQSATGTSYEISQCDISYYPADLKKPPLEPRIKMP